MVCHVSTIKHWPDWHSSTRLSFCFAMLNVANRSTNQCLSDKTGITVKGTRMPVNWATLLALTSLISIFIPVNTVRTIQSATWFSAGKKLTVDNDFFSAVMRFIVQLRTYKAKRLIKISLFSPIIIA
ncbi:Protein induced by aluminum [Escherichia coli]|uniref:Protein induced by aluminum n=1 Tax=Escherichia coli TaxID=562 RepID=A0A376U814_ECOLX|nr:Protein induced by aluminum [Escherichia coli]